MFIQQCFSNINFVSGIPEFFITLISVYLEGFIYLSNVSPELYIEKFNINLLLSSTVPIKIYLNADLDKKRIILENKDKAGVYQFINLLTGESYVGSSTNLSRRFKQYFNYSYISSPARGRSIVYSSILNNGYSNFNIIILEYCKIENTIIREQFYIDVINPTMNILQMAGNSLGFKHSEEIKELMRINNIGDRNPMFNKTHSLEYREILKERMTNNNPMAGKPCSEEVKAIIRKVQSIPLYVYDAKTKLLLFKYNSQKEFLKAFKVSDKTLTKYVLSGAIFREQYILSNNLLDETSK